MKRILKIDPKQGVADPDGRIVWYDCKDIGVEGKGWEQTESFYDRLPAKARHTVPGAVWDLSHDSAGLCVRFSTDSASIQVRWTLLKDSLAMAHMPATGVSGVDLYVRHASGRWQFAGNGQPVAVSNTATFLTSPGKPCLLYLPLYNGVKSVEIGIPKEHHLATTRERRKTVVFYGTSITQGGCASRPGLAATAIVGRELDVSVINLGFSGNGRMESEMADLLAELDPTLYVLDCLWNMQPNQVTERIEPFVRKLRGAHPGTPILLAEDSSFANATPTEKGRLLRAVREQLMREGIGGLHFLSNEGMLGNDSEGTVDRCHPNDVGMMRQAAVFAAALIPILRSSK